jgi:hypothetical protein
MPYDTTLHAVATGRAATVAELRRLADRLEALPLEDAAEVLICKTLYAIRQTVTGDVGIFLP